MPTNRSRTTLKLSGGIPLKDKDQQYPEDYIQDMDYVDGKVGDALDDLATAVPCLFQNVGTPTIYSTTQLSLPSVRGLVFDPSKSIVRCLNINSVATITPNISPGDGVYYIKYRYNEADTGSTRSKVFQTASYNWETVDSYLLSMDKTPPEEDIEICLGNFTVLSGSIVGISSTYRSPAMTLNSLTIALENNSVIESKLSPEVRDKLNAGGGSIARILTPRGVLFKITQDELDSRRGYFVVDPDTAAGGFFVKEDGTLLTIWNMEQQYPVSRLISKSVSGSNSYAVPLSLSEVATNKLSITFPSEGIVKSTKLSRVALKCHTKGSGYTALRFTLHNSVNTLLEVIDVAIGDLADNTEFCVEFDYNFAEYGEVYHVHAHIQDGTYVSQPYLTVSTISDFSTAYYVAYYKPDGGMYPSADVMNIRHIVGGVDTQLVPTRLISGDAWKSDESTIDFYPFDFIANGGWPGSSDYNEYIWVDCVAGRVQFPTGYDAGDYGIELNFKYNVTDINGRLLPAYNQNYSLEDFIFNESTKIIKGKIALGGASSPGAYTLHVTGDVYATSYTSASAKALKENIEKFEERATDIIEKIMLYKFNFKGDKEKNPKLGFLAENEDPLIATKNNDAHDHGNSIGLLYKAVQELIADVKIIKARM